MAQRTIIELEDDLSGAPAVESIEFGLDGTTYAIDLNKRIEAKLRKVLDQYVPHARKAGATQRSSTSRARPARPSSDLNTHAVRTWAESNGYEVSTRGRIAKKILDDYHSALG